MNRVQAEELLTLLEEWLDLKEEADVQLHGSPTIHGKLLEDADEARGLLADKMVEVCGG